MLVGVVSCSVEQEPSTLSVAGSTSTTAALADETLDLPVLPGTPPAEITAALDAAVAAGDMCALAAAIESGTPDANDPDAVIEAYESLARAVDAAPSFLPEELEEAWAEIDAGLALALPELRIAVGRPDAPAVVAILSGDSMQSAVNSVQRWRDRNCADSPPGSVPSTTALSSP